MEAHTSARRPPTLPWPDPSWTTVPEFGILCSSATLTPLRSYRGRPLDGRGPVWSHQCHSALKNLKWHHWQTGCLIIEPLLLYKILHRLVNIPQESVDITKSNSTPRGVSNPHKLQRPRAQQKSSPLWNSTIFRTIPQWNQLPASIAEADFLTAFKSWLVCSSP